MGAVESRLKLNGVCYDLKSDGTATVVGCATDAPKILAFPKTVFRNGRAFFVQSISGLKGWNGAKVAIPRMIEFIREECFFRARFLREVIFESDSNLKRIDGAAFFDCGLKSVRIPSKVEFIGEECFSFCRSLSEVIFESDSNLKRIDGRAFSYSGLKSVRIPAKVEFIGENCFYDCESLSEVIFESDSNLKRIENNAFSSSGLKSVRIPATVEFLGAYCFYYCNSLREVIFEGKVNIAKSAFELCTLKSVKVPLRVKLNYSFGRWCRIEYVTIGDRDSLRESAVEDLTANHGGCVVE
jgi:hypothetical protein